MTPTPKLLMNRPFTDPDPRTNGALYAQMVNALFGILDAAAPGMSVIPRGADPTGGGAADSAFVDLLVDLLGSADPTTTARTPKAAGWLPAGVYKTSDPIHPRSAQGLRIAGEGPETTFIEVDGSPDSVFDLDGIYRGVLEDLTVTGGSPDKVFNLHWGAGTYRSTTGFHFQRCDVHDCAFRSAFAIGTDTDNQVDGTLILNSRVSGVWSAGNTATYQNGAELGDGEYGNGLDHWIIATDVDHVRRGVHCRATSFHYLYGQMENNEVDFYIRGMSDPCSIKGIRSEGATRLVDALGAGENPQSLSIEDAEFNAQNLAGDGQWIAYRGSGCIYLKNLTQKNAPADPDTREVLVPPLILCDAAARGDGLVGLTVVADGIVQQNNVDGGLVSDAHPTMWVIRNYQEVDKDGVLVHLTPFLVKQEPGNIHLLEVTGDGKVKILGKEVSFGAADSGGSGFKLLRVPN